MIKLFKLPLLLAVFFLLSCSNTDNVFESPNGEIKFSIQLDTLDNKVNVPFYSVIQGDKVLIDESAIEIEVNGKLLTENLKLIEKSTKLINNSWERIWGKETTVADNYNQLKLKYQNTETSQEFELIVRAYDEGIAFRYSLPLNAQDDTLLLTKEQSRFNFTDNHTCWATNVRRFYSSQEREFDINSLSEIKDTVLLGMPVVVEIDKQNYVAITEANLTDWAGMFLKKGKSENSIVTTLSPLPGEKGILVKSSTQRYSPWRTIMIGDDLGDLVENNMLSNLNEPCAIENTDWIKPGKSAWDWWWCNYYAPDADFKMGPNQETMKYFIDFAAEMGWEYQLVDWQWYGEPFSKMPKANPDADITTNNPNINIEELVKYANPKGVDILVWLQWESARDQMEKAFPLYEKWGVKGVKVDFMNREDQEMVNFYHRLVKLAAKHHLLVDFHGAYKPTGWSRTYPNLVTREGILGNEYTKWSPRITLEHTVTIPFTRGLLGELDFTPGGYYNVHDEDFKLQSQNPCPTVRGTRCHQLAMNVVYESVLQVMCGAPYNYRTYPQGNEFLKQVPTTWDDTKYIDGYPGDFVVMARRNGTDWYVGGMSDEEARSVSFKADFLGKGEFTATFWSDDKIKSEEDPKNLQKSEIELNADTQLDIDMIRGGGFVMIISPK